MFRKGSLLLALCCASAAWAQTEAKTPGQASQISGQVRLQWDQRSTRFSSPAAALASGATLETELRSSGHGVSGIVTLQQQRQQGQSTDSRAWVNELYASHDAGAWQLSAGKKIVAWDVGYGYRPNDLVQQEARRALINSTLEGRPLLIVEHFNADTAWSWVWVNPVKSAQELGAQEPALASRVYHRDGAVDWHGFARAGAHTGISVGAAVAWVASEALELHSSWRWSERVDRQTLNPNANGLVAGAPRPARTDRDVQQFLLGGTWTHSSQLSLLAEAWLDAQSQRNLYGRLSWQHDAWQPALDWLYQPADQGRVVTASLIWQGDRVQLQGGLRVYDGPANAQVMQQPLRSQAYVIGTWAF